MHLVFLSPELLTIGGIQRYNRLSIAALDRYVAAHGGALSVLCLNDSPPSHLPPELSDLSASTLSYFSGNRSSFIYNFSFRVRQATLVIYGLLGFSPLVMIQGLLNREARAVLMLYGIEAWHYRSRLHAWGVDQMECFVSISQYTLEEFRHAYRLDAIQPVYVVPNPVCPELLAGAESDRCRTGSNSPRLLSVSRLDSTEQAKGIDSVIRALPSLLLQFPDLAYLVVGDGTDRARLEALANKLGVQNAVRFLGFVEEWELRQLFAGCTIYVMPSAKEGFGFVFIEAMAYGKPVVAARAGATPEVVEHGRTGLLVEYDNVPQLVEAIAQLLNDDQVRQMMGLAGQETVREKYTFEAFSDRWSSVCRSLGMTQVSVGTQ